MRTFKHLHLFFKHPLALVTLAGIFAIPSLSRAVPPPGYYLVWSDEFNGTHLDRSKWDYWLLGPRRNAVNVTNAISLDGSNLVITTYTSNKVHYTGFVATDETFRSRYGYWESRIRWGDTNGMWSAFWLQSPEMVSRAPDAQLSGSEIDIAEHRYLDKDAKNIANQIQVNIHWNGYGRTSRSAGSGNKGTNLANGFHTYGFLSTSNSYAFLIDDAKIYSGGAAPISHSAEWAILSGEVDDTSTTWAGHIPSEGYGSLGESTTRMMVDYVRYYAPSNVLFWTGAASANWTDANNWVAGKQPRADSELTFTYLSTNASTVLDGSCAVNKIVLLQTKQDVSISGSGTLRLGSGGIDLQTANRALTVNAPIEITAPQNWFVGQKAGALKVTRAVSGEETLTKNGPGTLILDTTEAFDAPLKIDAGVVSLGAAIRTLNFSGGLTLSSNSTMVLKVDAARHTNDEVRIAGSAAFAGGLTVSNVAGDLKEGDSFKLFTAAHFSGTFEHLMLPTLPPNLEWNTRNLTNGLLSVISSNSQP
jgi:beta-glucanase (GH16 family)